MADAGITNSTPPATAPNSGYLGRWPSLRELPVVELAGSGYAMMVIDADVPPVRVNPGEWIKFIQNFREELRDRYPPPALAPYEARDSSLHPENMSIWRIRLAHGVALRQPIPIKLLLQMLNAILGLTRRFGPAELLVAIAPGTSRIGFAFPAYTLCMEIKAIPSQFSTSRNQTSQIGAL